jgi:hypothetical protein
VIRRGSGGSSSDGSRQTPSPLPGTSRTRTSNSIRSGALVVARAALFSFEVTLAHGSNMADVERRSVPLDQVGSVTVRSAAWIGKEPAEEEQASAISMQLVKELPPFGKEISLPFSRDDYKGSRDRARTAARQIADALSSIMRAA